MQHKTQKITQKLKINAHKQTEKKEPKKKKKNSQSKKDRGLVGRFMDDRDLATEEELKTYRVVTLEGEDLKFMFLV